MDLRAADDPSTHGKRSGILSFFVSTCHGSLGGDDLESPRRICIISLISNHDINKCFLVFFLSLPLQILRYYFRYGCCIRCKIFHRKRILFRWKINLLAIFFFFYKRVKTDEKFLLVYFLLV